MSTFLVDSYGEENPVIYGMPLSAAQDIKTAQSFTGQWGKLYQAKFYIKKAGSGGSPTGNATAKLYAHSGTYGTSSVPTGAALATSAVRDVSEFNTSYQIETFTFTDEYELSDDVYYCISVEYGDGDSSNRVDVGCNNEGGHGEILIALIMKRFINSICFFLFTDNQRMLLLRLSQAPGNMTS